MNSEFGSQIGIAALVFFALFWIVFLYSAQKLYTIASLLRDILAELRVRNALDASEKGNLGPFVR